MSQKQPISGVSKQLLRYLEKLVASAENTQYKYKYRQALFELGSNLSATGQITSAFRTLENGLRISLTKKFISGWQLPDYIDAQ